MSRPRFNLDERETRTLRQVSSVLYVITLYALIGLQLYRQFVLKQPRQEWNDLALLIAFNVIAWLGALLYLGGDIHPGQVRLRPVLIGFAGFVVIGSAFTFFKYAVLLGQALSLPQMLDIFLTVVTISALLAALLGLVAYLGYRRMEKRIQ